MEIVEFDKKYTEQISKIIIENLIEVNSKDYGLEYVKKTAQEFTPEEISNLYESSSVELAEEATL